jgi:hypothetical protein
MFVNSRYVDIVQKNPSRLIFEKIELKCGETVSFILFFFFCHQPQICLLIFTHKEKYSFFREKYFYTLRALSK